MLVHALMKKINRIKNMQYISNCKAWKFCRLIIAGESWHFNLMNGSYLPRKHKYTLVEAEGYTQDDNNPLFVYIRRCLQRYIEQWKTHKKVPPTLHWAMKNSNSIQKYFYLCKRLDGIGQPFVGFLPGKRMAYRTYMTVRAQSVATGMDGRTNNEHLPSWQRISSSIYIIQ